MLKSPVFNLYDIVITNFKEIKEIIAIRTLNNTNLYGVQDNRSISYLYEYFEPQNEYSKIIYGKNVDPKTRILWYSESELSLEDPLQAITTIMKLEIFNQ